MPRLRPIAGRLLIAPLLGLAISVSAATAGVAQTVAVPNAATCASCTLVADTLFSLGGVDADMLAPNSQLARDSRGRFYGTGWGFQSILVWDSTGRYVRTIGGPGQGPGEFAQSIQHILIGRGDSLVVTDRSLRVSIFSPSAAFVRSFKTLVRPTSLAALPNGQLLLGAYINTPTQIGQLFHILDPVTGDIVRSFGYGGATIIAKQPDQGVLFVPSADGASLWNWPLHEYRLQGWRVDGTRREILDMSSTPWFQVRQEPTPLAAAEMARDFGLSMGWPAAKRDSMFKANDAKQPPASTLQVAGTDRSGQIWVVTTEPFVLGSDPTTIRSWLDVIDPATGRKVVSTRVPKEFKLIRGTDLAYSRSVDATTGVTTLTVSRVHIQGR